MDTRETFPSKAPPLVTRDVTTVHPVDTLRAGLDVRQHLTRDALRNGHGRLAQTLFELLSALCVRRNLCGHPILHLLP